ncbi:MAG TPA: PEP-CTERM sorting domain-containing protein [Roseateles sp.]
MNTKLLLAAAVLLGLAGAAQAAPVRFDNPDPIVIDGANVATYTEVGFALSGQAVALQTLALGAMATAQFDGAWRGLSEVRFSATSGFQLDNVAAVPEPGSVALLALGLGGLMLTRRRRAPV